MSYDPYDPRLVYGGDEILEYGDQLVVVPRICELCLEHVAVYYSCSQWPATYECRWCLEGPVERDRVYYGARRNYAPVSELPE